MKLGDYICIEGFNNFSVGDIVKMTCDDDGMSDFTIMRVFRFRGNEYSLSSTFFDIYFKKHDIIEVRNKKINKLLK